MELSKRKGITKFMNFILPVGILDMRFNIISADIKFENLDWYDFTFMKNQCIFLKSQLHICAQCSKKWLPYCDIGKSYKSPLRQSFYVMRYMLHSIYINFILGISCFFQNITRIKNCNFIYFTALSQYSRCSWLNLW